MKKLGIIIPCYNCENSIEACINSIICQEEFKYCEIILINDGSSDNTLEIIEKYFDNDSVVVYSQENKGVSSARNKGLELCSTEYIMFVDSDDLLYDGSLNIIFSNLNYCRNSFLIYGLRQEFYRNEILKKCLNVKPISNECINIDEDSKLLIKYLENNLINGPYAKIFESKIIKKYNLRFNEELKIQEDLCFNIQYISKIKKVYFYNELVYRYLICSRQSITSKFLPDRIDNYRYVERIIYDFFDSKDLEEEFKSELYYIYIKDTWSSIINSFYPENKFSLKERKMFVEKILAECDWEIIAKARRKGIKYKILKVILELKNVFLICVMGKLISFIKKRMYINYK